MTADRENAKARRVWDKAAPRYDDSMAFFERTFIDDGRSWLVSRARGRVLEIAVGTGIDLPLYSGEVSITGLDLSPAMLRIARRRAAELGREVRFVVGDAQKLPFDDGSFDSVVTALALCSVPDPARAIGEMRRVLAPGGRLLLLDHIRSSWPPDRCRPVAGRAPDDPRGGRASHASPAAAREGSGVRGDRIRAHQGGDIERIHARTP